jgi:F-type H+-transporting ATPase subunit delta
VENLFGDPRVSTQQLAELIIGVCGDGLSELGQNFVRVLSQYRRLDVLPEITALYELQKAEFENSVDVSVTSAVPFDEKQRKQLIASLKKRLGRDIRLHCETDENLIGGAVVRADDLVIDGSLRGKLSRLAAEMTH